VTEFSAPTGSSSLTPASTSVAGCTCRHGSVQEPLRSPLFRVTKRVTRRSETPRAGPALASTTRARPTQRGSDPRSGASAPHGDTTGGCVGGGGRPHPPPPQMRPDPTRHRRWLWKVCGAHHQWRITVQHFVAPDLGRAGRSISAHMVEPNAARPPSGSTEFFHRARPADPREPANICFAARCRRVSFTPLDETVDDTPRDATRFTGRTAGRRPDGSLRPPVPLWPACDRPLREVPTSRTIGDMAWLAEPQR
jgi:hypothetical protein